MPNCMAETPNIVGGGGGGGGGSRTELVVSEGVGGGGAGIFHWRQCSEDLWEGGGGGGGGGAAGLREDGPPVLVCVWGEGLVRRLGIVFTTVVRGGELVPVSGVTSMGLGAWCVSWPFCWWTL